MLRNAVATLVAAANLVAAATPPGFSPGSAVDLFLVFNGTLAIHGSNIDRSLVLTQPSLFTPAQLTGKSYALIMVDLDIPTNSPPTTSTLLHWLQTGLTPATTASSLLTAPGSGGADDATAFALLNSSNTPSFAPYIPPTPPARIPLSHRYTEILIDTSNATTSAINMLQTAAQNRTAFDAAAVLKSAGLAGSVVAGNFFNVTNAGPATGPGTNVTTTTTTGSASATTTSTSTGSGSGSSSASASATTITSAGTTVTSTSASGTASVSATATAGAVMLGLGPQSWGMLGLIAVGGLFAGL